jgi:DNA-binding MurR/RpiR family transcriptional regulator
MNKTQLTRLARSVQENPVMLAKVNALHAGIKTDLRKRNTPSRRVIEALTHEQLAEKCETTPTTLTRFMHKHGIIGDVRVGSRLAYSKPLAEKIREAVFFSKLALCATHSAHLIRDTHPDEAAQGDALAAEYRADLARVLSKI